MGKKSKSRMKRDLTFVEHLSIKDGGDFDGEHPIESVEIQAESPFVPLEGKKMYIRGYLLKCLVLVFIFLLFEIFFISFIDITDWSGVDIDLFIALWWREILLLHFTLAFLFILVVRKPNRISKKWIENYRIEEKGVALLHHDKTETYIHYQNILTAAATSVGTGSYLFQVYYYCEDKQDYVNIPRMFMADTGFTVIVPIKNERMLISTFLKQLHKINPSAKIDTRFIWAFHIDDQTFDFNPRAYWVEKFCWTIFFSIILLVCIYLV